MIFKAIEWTGASGIPEYDYEEVPEEELWEDGELNIKEVEEKIIYRVLQEGCWMLVREVDNGKD